MIHVKKGKICLNSSKAKQVVAIRGRIRKKCCTLISKEEVAVTKMNELVIA